MKASELRIGNWVNKFWKLRPDVNYIPMRVQSIKDDVIYFDNNGEEKFRDKQDIDYLKPIPLTEQWLKDFGFEYDNSFYQDAEGKFFFNTDLGFERFIGYLGEWNKPDECKEIGEIKYVHQLQNLYFALTGKELEKK